MVEYFLKIYYNNHNLNMWLCVEYDNSEIIVKS